jgi:hypothetical protein
MQTSIHASNGIRTQDPTVRARKDISCLRPHGHCDRPKSTNAFRKYAYLLYFRRSYKSNVTYLLTCDLFNDTVSSSGYIKSNDGQSANNWGKMLMEVVVARFSGTIPASAQGLTKTPKTVWTAGLSAEIQVSVINFLFNVNI